MRSGDVKNGTLLSNFPMAWVCIEFSGSRGKMRGSWRGCMTDAVCRTSRPERLQFFGRSISAGSSGTRLSCKAVAGDGIAGSQRAVRIPALSLCGEGEQHQCACRRGIVGREYGFLRIALPAAGPGPHGICEPVSAHHENQAACSEEPNVCCDSRRTDRKSVV